MLLALLFPFPLVLGANLQDGAAYVLGGPPHPSPRKTLRNTYSEPCLLGTSRSSQADVSMVEEYPGQQDMNGGSLMNLEERNERARDTKNDNKTGFLIKPCFIISQKLLYSKWARGRGRVSGLLEYWSRNSPN